MVLVLCYPCAQFQQEDRTLNDLRLTVPQASGEAAVIEQLTHSKTVENLGLFI